jgi:hypothetical protein
VVKVNVLPGAIAKLREGKKAEKAQAALPPGETPKALPPAESSGLLAVADLAKKAGKSNRTCDNLKFTLDNRTCDNLKFTLDNRTCDNLKFALDNRTCVMTILSSHFLLSHCDYVLNAETAVT